MEVITMKKNIVIAIAAVAALTLHKFVERKFWVYKTLKVWLFKKPFDVGEVKVNLIGEEIGVVTSVVGAAMLVKNGYKPVLVPIFKTKNSGTPAIYSDSWGNPHFITVNGPFMEMEENEKMAVIGHELGHVVHQHSNSRLVNHFSGRLMEKEMVADAYGAQLTSTKDMMDALLNISFEFDTPNARGRIEVLERMIALGDTWWAPVALARALEGEGEW